MRKYSFLITPYTVVTMNIFVIRMKFLHQSKIIQLDISSYFHDIWTNTEHALSETNEPKTCKLDDNPNSKQDFRVSNLDR